MIQKFTRLCDSAIPQSVASYITSFVSLPAWLPGVFFRVLCYQLTTAIEPNSCLCEDGEDFRQHCNYQKSNHCRWWCGSGECAVHGIHVTLKDCFESVWNCPVSQKQMLCLHHFVISRGMARSCTHGSILVTPQHRIKRCITFRAFSLTASIILARLSAHFLAFVNGNHVPTTMH